MATRPAEYLFIRVSKSLSIPETGSTGLGSGKTLSAKICASNLGAPAAIGSLSYTATASGSLYSISIPRADMVSGLASSLNKRVWLHLDDGAAWHDTWEYLVTDVDPDLLPALR